MLRLIIGLLSFTNLALGLAEVADSVEEDMKSKEWVDYLVQLTPHPCVKNGYNEDVDIKELESHAEKSQYDLMNKLKRYETQGSVKYIKPYYITNTVAITSKKDVVEEIKGMDKVEEISSNRKFKVVGSNAFNNDEAIILNEVNWTGETELWSIDYINATNMSPRTRSNAAYLRYANADTGIEYTHPSIVNNYLGLRKDGTFDHNYSWWDANKRANTSRPNLKCGINSPVPCGDDDHGTHTMSTVVGALGLGVSPTTKWMACKNMDNNFGSPESYLGCLQFFLAPTKLDGTDPRPDLRPHVVGNSYTCPPQEGCSPTTFQYALKVLKLSGIIMSVSAGNSGSEGCGSIRYPPALDPNSFTVGALNYRSDARAYFSSLGPASLRTPLPGLDIMAPGVNITGAALNGGYKALAGTSMASPHISGAALLITAACPQLYRQVDAIEQLIRETATPLYTKLTCGGDVSTTYPNNEYGYGKVNVGKAISVCQLQTQSSNGFRILSDPQVIVDANVGSSGSSTNLLSPSLSR